MSAASADVPLKGLSYLLRALASLVGEFPDLELAVLGQAKARGRTSRLIDELGLGRRVRFLNGLSSEDLAREYARSALAVIPSLYEGFGLPAAEAMACGVPVVATTGGALPEVVGDAGILVPPGDEQSLSVAIRKLLLDPCLRQCLGRDGRRRMQELFTWRQCAQRTVEAYRRAMS
jgi:glycosyltransferase involved in cell wall biosynthesis